MKKQIDKNNTYSRLMCLKCNRLKLFILPLKDFASFIKSSKNHMLIKQKNKWKTTKKKLKGELVCIKLSIYFISLILWYCMHHLQKQNDFNFNIILYDYVSKTYCSVIKCFNKSNPGEILFFRNAFVSKRIIENKSWTVKY